MKVGRRLILRASELIWIVLHNNTFTHAFTHACTSHIILYVFVMRLISANLQPEMVGYESMGSIETYFLQLSLTSEVVWVVII